MYNQYNPYINRFYGQQQANMPQPMDLPMQQQNTPQMALNRQNILYGKQDDTYQYLSNKARLKGTMLDDRDFILDFLDERYERVPTYNLSFGEVSAKYNDNVILITMTGHIVCSKYGVIYDSFDCRKRQAEYCWIVK